VRTIGKNTIAYSPLLGATFGTDPNGYFRVAHLDTGVVGKVRTVATPTDIHELLALPNGNTMLLSYPFIENVNLSPRGPSSATVADCNIQEVAPDGSLVWSWTGSEHIDPVVESTLLQTTTINGQSVVDPFHCNSIDVNPDGDVLVSARHLDAVFLITRATGQIAWKLGGVPQNKDIAQIVTMESDPETSFYQQHDARWLPNGNISIFDDHGSQAGSARGMEIALDVDNGVAHVAWQYAGSAHSSAMGSTRRYADGSTVIGWGLLGASNGPATALTEVDASGNVLFEVTFSLGDHVYRATKESLETLDIDVLRATAGHASP
jgi:hypothetical protein